MKKELWFYGILIVIALFLMTGFTSWAQTTESNQQTTPGIWFAFVPPRGVEQDLPPFDQWVKLLVKAETPYAMELDAASLDNPYTFLFFQVFGVNPDGNDVTPFQLEHIVYINSETKEVRKSSHYK